MERVEVVQNVLKENDRIAAELRAGFRARRTLCLNLISSPGAGKTSLLEQTLGDARRQPLARGGPDRRHPDRSGRSPPARVRISGAADHDRRHVSSRRVHGAQSAGGGLPPDPLDLLFIENVGNLVCPASYDLGEEAKVVVLSVAEGDDKPLKYPSIFRRARLMLLHKIDLLPYTTVQRRCREGRRPAGQPVDIEIIETSCVGPPGLSGWLRGWTRG